MTGANSTILFAGGGTGGHISPGLALAEQIADLAPERRRLFACSERPIDARMLTAANERFITIPAAPFSVRPGGFLRFLRAWNRSKRAARELFDRESVGIVVALGGFVAAPVIAAANRSDLPTVMINLDVVPGKANRWLGTHCDTIVSAVETPDFPAFSKQLIGMPLRQRAIAAQSPAECRRALELAPDRKTLLITGASQGAQSLNEFVLTILAQYPETFRPWQFLHLAGPDRADGLQARYAELGATARVIPFLDEMGLAWGAADLAFSRAGANSVAEAWTNAVPTVFFPYPWHRDRHQYANAEPMVRAGGAIVVDDLIEPARNAQQHWPLIRAIMEDPEALPTMRQSLEESPHRDAARVIARLILDRIA